MATIVEVARRARVSIATVSNVHLFDILGIPKNAEGLYRIGLGVVVSARLSPAALTYERNGAETLRTFAHRAAIAAKLQWKETNALVLQRGPYIIAAGLNESIPNSRPYVLHGQFINLFDSTLPVLTNVRLTPGSRSLLLTLDTPSAGTSPAVVAAACKIRDVQASKTKLRFLSDGIADTNAFVRVRTRLRPANISVNGKPLEQKDYKITRNTLLVHFLNSVDPVRVEINFAR
jgi:hypothetical protein